MYTHPYVIGVHSSDWESTLIKEGCHRFESCWIPVEGQRTIGAVDTSFPTVPSMTAERPRDLKSVAKRLIELHVVWEPTEYFPCHKTAPAYNCGDMIEPLGPEHD